MSRNQSPGYREELSKHAAPRGLILSDLEGVPREHRGAMYFSVGLRQMLSNRP
jgi:hypothetical protein